MARLGSTKSGWATTVWVDPGGTTGWGVMAVKPEVLADSSRRIERNIQHWACGETHHNEDQMASEMLELYAMWDDAAIGIEKFQLRQMAVELSPVSITAKIRYGLWLAEKWAADDEDRDMGRPRMLFTQMPSLAKSTLTDDRQRQYRLWEPGKDHKRDAIKHCYTFLVRAQQTPRLRYTAWPTLYRTDGTLLKKRPPTSKATTRGRKQ